MGVGIICRSNIQDPRGRDSRMAQFWLSFGSMTVSCRNARHSVVIRSLTGRFPVFPKRPVPGNSMRAVAPQPWTRRWRHEGPKRPGLWKSRGKLSGPSEKTARNPMRRDMVRQANWRRCRGEIPEGKERSDHPGRESREDIGETSVAGRATGPEIPQVRR